MNKIIRSDLYLLIAAGIWGSAFVSQKAAMDSMGPLLFTGIRFLTGGLFLLFILSIRKLLNRNTHNIIAKPNKKTYWLKGVLIIGTLAFVGSCLQQFGVVHTTAGRAGFITGIYVVLVPILGLLFGAKTRWWNWGGTFLCLLGLVFLSAPHLTGTDKGIILGDSLVGICAIVFALHVLAIDYFVKRIDGITLATGQALITGLGALVLVIIFEPTTLEIAFNLIVENALLIIHAGLLSVGIAYTLQILGQKNSPPAHAAIILSLEAPFAALGGFVFLNETLSNIEFLGSGIMLFAMLFSQVPLLYKK